MDLRTHRLSLESIERASGTIDPVFLRTPQFEADRLSNLLDCRLIVKVETVNPIRCFKGRGAAYFVASLPADSRLICASAGNFGQGLAYVCRTRGVPLTVYASDTANPYKLGRMRALGAKVVLRGLDFDAAKLEAKRVAAETPGLRHVEDGLEPLIAEGAGTIGVELARFPADIDDVLIPVGNGALIGGVARWFKHARPRTRVIAVQAAGATAMVDSWRAGRVLEGSAIATIADGIGVRIPVPQAVEDMHGLVDDAVVVEDEKLIRAMKLAFQDLGLVLEPSGAAGIAAVLVAPERFTGRTVATILCGANLTVEQGRQWLLA